MGNVTEPSLYHSEALGVILFLHLDPEDVYQTVVLIHCNKHPFTQSQKVVIPYRTFNSTFSIDRRSSDEQSKDMSIFVGLSKTASEDSRHKVAKLKFEGTKCQEAVDLSEEV